jgi:hypothetical protein
MEQKMTKLVIRLLAAALSATATVAIAQTGADQRMAVPAAADANVRNLLISRAQSVQPATPEAGGPVIGETVKKSAAAAALTKRAN